VFISGAVAEFTSPLGVHVVVFRTVTQSRDFKVMSLNLDLMTRLPSGPLHRQLSSLLDMRTPTRPPLAIGSDARQIVPLAFPISDDKSPPHPAK
jgi:hypothetical protein